MTTATSNGKPQRARDNRPRVTPEILDKMPPANLDAERAVLGSILLDPKRLPEVRDIVGPEHFHDARNEAILRALLWMAADGNPIDVITLAASLKAAGEWQRAGNAAYLAEVARSVPVAGHVGYHAKLVKAAADRAGPVTAGRTCVAVGPWNGEIGDAHAELLELLDPEIGKAARPATRLAPGTRVYAGDRGNIGDIVADNGPTCLVHFHGKEGTRIRT